MSYIERDKIEKFFDGIYDCADLTFEPNDHCCDADDCAHCKWYETKNAIRKRILSIPAADVRPIIRGHWITEEEAEAKGNYLLRDTCSVCGRCDWDDTESKYFNFCPNCGAMMEES